jgi:hypothetical protein
MSTLFSKIICVSYTDEFSSDKNSHNDTIIGYQHRLVSSGNILLNKATPGTLCIVRNERGYFYICVLISKMTMPVSLWKDYPHDFHAGKMFKYTWTTFNLTDILSIDKIFKSEQIKELTDNCNIKNLRLMFNSRLCGYGVKYMPFINEAMRKGIDDLSFPYLVKYYEYEASIPK